MDLREFLEIKMSTIEGDITTSIVETWVQRYKDIENTKATVFTDISNFNEWKEGRNVYESIKETNIKFPNVEVTTKPQQSEEGKEHDILLKKQREWLGNSLVTDECVTTSEKVKVGDKIKLGFVENTTFRVYAITKKGNYYFAWFYNNKGNRESILLENIIEVFRQTQKITTK